MSIDTYGLSTEQYEDFFEDNINFAVKLYVNTCKVFKDNGIETFDFKTILDMYQEATYAANDDCRRYQKTNNPEVLKDTDLLGIYPSREELLTEIQSVNTKVEKLTDSLSELVKLIAENQ